MTLTFSIKHTLKISSDISGVIAVDGKPNLDTIDELYHFDCLNRGFTAFEKNRNSVKSNKYSFVFILVQLLHIRYDVNGSHFFAFSKLFSVFSLVKYLASMHRYVGARNPHDNNWIDNSYRSFKTKFMANCLPHFSSLMNRQRTLNWCYQTDGTCEKNIPPPFQFHYQFDSHFYVKAFFHSLPKNDALSYRSLWVFLPQPKSFSP